MEKNQEKNSHRIKIINIPNIGNDIMIYLYVKSKILLKDIFKDEILKSKYEKIRVIEKHEYYDGILGPYARKDLKKVAIEKLTSNHGTVNFNKKTTIAISKGEYNPLYYSTTLLKKRCILFMVHDGIIIGWISGELFDDDINNKYIEIDWVEVHPLYGGKGICKILLEYLILNMQNEYNNFILDNEAGSIGCKCYVGTFTQLGYDAYNLDTNQSVLISTCNLNPDSQNGFIKFTKQGKSGGGNPINNNAEYKYLKYKKKYLKHKYGM
jgi:hypothetical protein